MPPTLEAMAMPMTMLCTRGTRQGCCGRAMNAYAWVGLHRAAQTGGGGAVTAWQRRGRTLPSIGLLCSRRRIGCTRAKHSTGAATLEIHMLENVAMNMEASTTERGRLTRAMMRTATAFAMKCFDSAAAIAKPPSSSMMTGENMTCVHRA